MLSGTSFHAFPTRGATPNVSLTRELPTVREEKGLRQPSLPRHTYIPSSFLCLLLTGLVQQERCLSGTGVEGVGEMVAVPWVEGGIGGQTVFSTLMATTIH